MKNSNLSDDQLAEICEDAFVNIKEACMRLQEKTRCSNQVVVDMLNNVADFYNSQEKQNARLLLFQFIVIKLIY